jgi:hypothetical protein
VTDQRTYLLADGFDGRTLLLLTRVSSRSLARKHANKYARTTADDFYLVELRDGGKREIVQHYAGLRR